MWHSRGKIFLTKDPNYIISSICYFPNINTTYQKYKEDNNLEKLQKDNKYRDIMAFYYAVHGGRDFIPIHMEDTCPKLGKLQIDYPLERSHFYCLGYVSDYIKEGSKALLKPCKSMDFPTLEIFMDWLEYYSTNYCDSTHSTVNRYMAEDYLRKYINTVSKDKIDSGRLFQLIYNNSTIFDKNRDWTIKDWLKYLKNLPNRDIFDIIVNDFK